ncbi:hypothetical protein BDW_03615 [Bdellovibrio bacteriovorus W]|nr:hypothetical protein BDW_03615 [Bdellovibrio bacteriovorus W]
MKKNLILGSLIVTSVMQAASPALANKETIGNIIGGVIGGAVGSQIGKGNGNKAAIIIGAIAGTMIGGKVGKDLDEADRRALVDAQNRALRDQLGRRNDWDGRSHGSRTGARGSFTSTREGYNSRTGEYCREYTSVISTRSGTETTRGIACSRRDGSWYEVRETEVRFNNPGHGGGGHGGQRPPQYPQPGYPQQPTYPSQPSYPQPPAPPTRPAPPSQGRYEGTVQLNQVTRRSGGEWFRITFNRPVSLSAVEVRALSHGVKLHEAVAHTVNGSQLRLHEFSPTGNFYAGQSVISSNSLNYGGGRDIIQVIDIRAESMGGYADLLVRVMSNSDYPSMSVTRY